MERDWLMGKGLNWFLLSKNKLPICQILKISHQINPKLLPNDIMEW